MVRVWVFFVVAVWVVVLVVVVIVNFLGVSFVIMRVVVFVWVLVISFWGSDNWFILDCVGGGGWIIIVVIIVELVGFWFEDEFFVLFRFTAVWSLGVWEVDRISVDFFIRGVEAGCRSCRGGSCWRGFGEVWSFFGGCRMLIVEKGMLEVFVLVMVIVIVVGMGISVVRVFGVVLVIDEIF